MPRRCPSPRANPAPAGLELLLPLALQWGERSGAGVARAIEVITSAPARLLGQAGIGTLQVGAAADVCVIDPALEWQARPEALKSQGKHTPFADYPLVGRARFTLVGGRLVHAARD